MLSSQYHGICFGARVLSFSFLLTFFSISSFIFVFIFSFFLQLSIHFFLFTILFFFPLYSNRPEMEPLSFQLSRELVYGNTWSQQVRGISSIVSSNCGSWALNFKVWFSISTAMRRSTVRMRKVNSSFHLRDGQKERCFELFRCTQKMGYD